MAEESRVYFREEQRFPDYLVIVIFVVAVVVLAASGTVGYKVLAAGQEINWEMLAGIVAGVAVPALVAVLFAMLKLTTEVRGDGIYVRFFPLHLRFKRLGYDDIKLHYPRKYSPIAEYGGWGIRWGIHGKAYNVKGDMGLQLEFNNGKSLLIGSQQADMAARAVSIATDKPARDVSV